MCSYLIQFLQFTPNGFSYRPSWSLLDTSVTVKWDSAAGEPHWPGVWIVCVRDSPPPPLPPFPSLVQEGWTLKETPTGALTPPTTHTYTDIPTCPACGFKLLMSVTILHFFYFSSVLFAYIVPESIWIHFYAKHRRIHPCSVCSLSLIMHFSWNLLFLVLASRVFTCLSPWPSTLHTPQWHTAGSRAAQYHPAELSTPWDNYPPLHPAPCCCFEARATQMQRECEEEKEDTHTKTCKMERVTLQLFTIRFFSYSSCHHVRHKHTELNNGLSLSFCLCPAAAPPAPPQIFVQSLTAVISRHTNIVTNVRQEAWVLCFVIFMGVGMRDPQAGGNVCVSACVWTHWQLCVHVLKQSACDDRHKEKHTSPVQCL